MRDIVRKKKRKANTFREKCTDPSSSGGNPGLCSPMRLPHREIFFRKSCIGIRQVCQLPALNKNAVANDGFLLVSCEGLTKKEPNSRRSVRKTFMVAFPRVKKYFIACISGNLQEAKPMFFSSTPNRSTRGFSLRTWIFGSLSLLFLVTLASYSFSLRHSEILKKIILEKSPRLFLVNQSAEALLININSQKDFVPNYLLDDDPDWLLRLNQNGENFNTLIQRVENEVHTRHEKNQIQDIRDAYHRYLKTVDSLIISYRREKKADIHSFRTEAEVHLAYTEELALDFKEMQNRKARKIQSFAEMEIIRIQRINFIMLFLIGGLLLALGWKASRSILHPLRQLAHGTHKKTFSGAGEIVALHKRISALLQNAGETSEALARSRESLEQAERMVVVARLAASMAHSIRNPLTSVKMRLFSLNRSLSLGPDQKEDLDVISEEIRHLDIIVQNFLEFSRPPKLKIQSISPSEVVDRTLVLLKHRLEAYEAIVTLHRETPLPAISGDPEQLKEVFVNIIENACQAMAGKQPHISISEKITESVESKGPMAQIRICDSGPGIPAENLSRIFEPFYTTKGEGTGLGLSIAYRIVENHGGTLGVQSTPEGTCFEIYLPAIPYLDAQGVS